MIEVRVKILYLKTVKFNKGSFDFIWRKQNDVVTIIPMVIVVKTIGWPHPLLPALLNPNKILPKPIVDKITLKISNFTFVMDKKGSSI